MSSIYAIRMKLLGILVYTVLTRVFKKSFARLMGREIKKFAGSSSQTILGFVEMDENLVASEEVEFTPTMSVYVSGRESESNSLF